MVLDHENMNVSVHDAGTPMHGGEKECLKGRCIPFGSYVSKVL